MTEKLTNGDYSQNSESKLETVEQIEEILQNAVVCLVAQRGAFYPNKDFGMRFASAEKEPFDKYLLSFARQALSSFDGVVVKSVCSTSEKLVFNLLINDDERIAEVNI